MIRPLWLALPLLVGVCTVLNATEIATTAATKDTLGQLVKELGSTSFHARETAARALETFGPVALPFLREALANADPETRRRLESLILVLEKTVALSPKKVTLNVKNRALGDVIKEISKQTGYKIVLQQPGFFHPTKHLDFHCEGLSFWEAMHRLCEEGDLTFLNYYNQEGTLNLSSQGTFVPYSYRSGPFLFIAQNFNQYRNVQLGQVARNSNQGLSRSESLNFNFSITVEPKLGLLSAGVVKLLAAYDDQQNSLIPETPSGEQVDLVRNSFYFAGNNARNPSVQAQVNLCRPSSKALEVKLIRGTVPVNLLIDEKPLVIADPVLKASGKKVKVEKLNFLIEEVKEKPNKQYQIKLTISRNADGDVNPYWVHSLYQRLELQDAAGKKFSINEVNWGNNSVAHAQVTLTFVNYTNGKFTPPTKLVFQKWITLQHEVAFEFKDLPLP